MVEQDCDMVSSLEETLNAIKDTMGGGIPVVVGSNNAEVVKKLNRFDSMRDVIGSFYVRVAILVVGAMIILVYQDYRKSARTRWILRLRRCLFMAAFIVLGGSFLLLFRVRLATIPSKIFCFG